MKNKEKITFGFSPHKNEVDLILFRPTKKYYILGLKWSTILYYINYLPF